MFKKAYFTLLVLVYSAVFITLISALSGYIFVEKKLELGKENREKAFQVAETGLEYYRWHLAHWPNDLQDGTGHAGPYVHTVNEMVNASDVQAQQLGSVGSERGRQGLGQLATLLSKIGPALHGERPVAFQ